MIVESEMTVNGQPLTVAEAMTVRVAIASFGMHLRHEGLGEDEAGKQITACYLNCIESISRKMEYKKEV